MQEIKFRFVYGIDGDEESYFSLKFTFAEIESREHLYAIDDNRALFKYSILARHQYTGLKDKNGVEIYDGDIISVDKADRNDSGECINLLTAVFYEDACFNAFKDNDISLLFVAVEQGVEVIGNIYEDQDLINS